MAELWTKLEDVLADILTLYQALLALSQKKKSVLVQGKADELNEMTKQEELLIFKISRLEKLRVGIIKQIITVRQLPNQPLTIAQVAALADAATAKRLTELGQQLKAIAEALTPLNEFNAQLLQRAIAFINFNINVLSQSVSESTYAPPTQPGKTGKSRVFLDQKV